MTSIQLYHGDCTEIMSQIPSGSIDAVITDPPYPHIKRDYGMMTETEWWEMMMVVCAETRRILKPAGSAVFILQPNSRKVGSMRGWLWEFMAWVCREWNMVQDVWWWNWNAAPTVHTHEANGLMRPSIKACVWAGDATCYRDQSGIMWTVADQTVSDKRVSRSLSYVPSGYSRREGRSREKSKLSGMATPFNIVPTANTSSKNGHGAGTPLKLADWWTRYIVPPGGVACDPFMGSGTMGVAAIQNGASFIGIEKMQKHFETAERRIMDTQPAFPV